MSDLPTDEDDYLDITLTEEAEFLQEYKSLLNSMKSWFTCYLPLKDEKEAIDKLVSDLPTDEEDYLDITLTEEAEFLQEYKSLLNSMKSWFTCYLPLKDEKEAIDKLVSDLPTDEEDYPDITLTEEAEFLQENKTLLNSMKSWFTCYHPC